MKLFAFLSSVALPGAFGAYCHGGPKELFKQQKIVIYSNGY